MLKLVLISSLLISISIARLYTGISSVTKYTKRNNQVSKTKLIVFEGRYIRYKVNYDDLNGWQILDSISYKYHSDSLVQLTYFKPKYDFEKNRSLTQYEIAETTHESMRDSNFIKNNFSALDDYVSDWNLIFYFNKNKNYRLLGHSKIVLNPPLIPTMFMKYGLPYNEILDSCSYTVKDSTLTNDIFYFENYRVQRDFQYEKDLLKTVTITVVDSNRQTNKYMESFEYK